MLIAWATIFCNSCCRLSLNNCVIFILKPNWTKKLWKFNCLKCASLMHSHTEWTDRADKLFFLLIFKLHRKKKQDLCRGFCSSHLNECVHSDMAVITHLMSQRGAWRACSWCCSFIINSLIRLVSWRGITLTDVAPSKEWHRFKQWIQITVLLLFNNYTWIHYPDNYLHD